MEEQNNVNIEDIFLSHGYKQNQEILINAEFLLGVLAFCRRVRDSQPKVAALTHYPKEVREIRNKDTKELERVDVIWEEHSAKSFANTAFSEQGGVAIVPDLSMYALQIENALTDTHLKNINEGIAFKFEQDGGGN